MSAHTAVDNVRTPGRKQARRLALAYGLTVFLSAFLLFQVQPIISKLILPWFGGAAAVWSVCLLFFQTPLATYGCAGDQYVFYEINPLVVELANNQFSFLRQSPAQITIVTGDARLSLEREPPQQFDVLAVDAFTSDAIPVHLLTREAFALYLRHIKPTGIVAVHVSNKYLDLVPVVRSAAASLEHKAVVIDSGADEAHAIYRAIWVLVGSEAGLLSQTPLHSDDESTQARHQIVWTDDYSSILQTFR